MLDELEAALNTVRDLAKKAAAIRAERLLMAQWHRERAIGADEAAEITMVYEAARDELDEHIANGDARVDLQVARALRLDKERCLDQGGVGLLARLDGDGDGTADRGEFVEALGAMEGISADASELSALYERLDVDGDGALSLPEIRKAFVVLAREEGKFRVTRKKLGRTAQEQRQAANKVQRHVAAEAAVDEEARNAKAAAEMAAQQAAAEEQQRREEEARMASSAKKQKMKQNRQQAQAKMIIRKERATREPAAPSKPGKK